MEISNLTRADYDQILAELEDFWGDRAKTVRHYHLYLFPNEFAESSFVVRERSRVLGYLLGFVGAGRDYGYIQFIGVRESVRKRAIARRLYERFFKYAETNGCAQVKAIARPTNESSILFHQALGFAIGPVEKDYGGPGEDRVVLLRPLNR